MNLTYNECQRAIDYILSAKRHVDRANEVVEDGSLEALQDAADRLSELTEWASAFYEDAQARMREIEETHDCYLEKIA